VLQTIDPVRKVNPVTHYKLNTRAGESYRPPFGNTYDARRNTPILSGLEGQKSP
jgi:hypothetical protein